MNIAESYPLENDADTYKGPANEWVYQWLRVDYGLCQSNSSSSILDNNHKT